MTTTNFPATTLIEAALIEAGDQVRVGQGDYRIVESVRFCGENGRSVAISFEPDADGAAGGFRTYRATRKIRAAKPIEGR